MLEIVSGKKNSAFFHPECAQSLPSYVHISSSYVSCAQTKFTYNNNNNNLPIGMATME